MMSNSNNTKNYILVVFAFFSIVIPFIIHEQAGGGDRWGAWFFAREIWETGTFQTNERNPVYSLFLALFWPLGYPLGPAVVRLFDALFLFSGVFALSRHYLGFRLSALTAIIWLPGLLWIHGIVIAHVVSALCWAFALRHGPTSRARFAYSYAFLLFAAMLRINYVPLLFLMMAYDLYRVVRAEGGVSLLSRLRPRRCDIPIAVLIGLLVLFSVRQLDHRWNNAQYTDIQWYGPDQTSLATAALVGSFAQWIIVNKHDGDFDNHDIYFIARDDLPEAKSLFDLYKYPDVFFGQIYTNKQIISTIMRITDLGEIMFRAGNRIYSHILAYPVFYALVLFALYRFYHHHLAPENRRVFFELIAACAVLTGPILIAWPSSTYLYHAVPMFILSGIGLGGWVREKLRIDKTFAAAAVTLACIVAFSNFATRSWQIGLEATEPGAWQRPYLVKEILGGHFREIEQQTKNCRGVMLTTFHTGMAAFTEKPVDTIYSIFEIPPFGRLGDTEYDGLRPERVDCIIIDKTSVRRNGTTFTTKWSRYENYLVPYIEKLHQMGAQTITYGPDGNLELTVLNPPR